jgi:hypothetical protein
MSAFTNDGTENRMRWKRGARGFMEVWFATLNHAESGVGYDDPDGSLRHCANSEIADLGLEIYLRRNGGWRHSRSLSALKTAHVEFGRVEPFDEIPVLF